MNLSLLGSILAGLDADVEAVLEPGPGRCCVAMKPVRETEERRRSAMVLRPAL